MRRILALFLVVMPQSVKRFVGRHAFGWEIDRTAHIGASVLLVSRLKMGPGASIGPLNVIRGLEELRLEEDAIIGGRNWISGFAPGTDHFEHTPNRRSALILGKHARLTTAHEIDCTDRVELGEHAAIAGYKTTILTHSLDLVRDRQVARPVEIGKHAAVMTDCVLNSGTNVPAYSIIAAGSVVSSRLAKEYTFYSGNPAQAVRELSPKLGYFRRGENETGQPEGEPAPAEEPIA
jgi:acetyltransferase-like isoleucine patch superfamily enzyme